MSSFGSNYEIPEKVNENVLMTLGNDVEMETFKTNVVPEEQEAIERQMSGEDDGLAVILCVGTITGKENVFLKEHFRRTPPKGSGLPTVCMDIHLKKIKLMPQSQKEPLSIFNEIDPESYEGFNFKSCHGTLVFWAPEIPSSLSEAAKWRKAVTEFANSQIPCVFLTFNSTNLEWMGKGKPFESEAALEQFCREHGFVTWFEMVDWGGDVFERALACLMDEIQTGENLNFIHEAGPVCSCTLSSQFHSKTVNPRGSCHVFKGTQLYGTIIILSLLSDRIVCIVG
ncbi:hypothetical protein ACROYT_G013413 [Oculina patagonica]